MKPSAAGRALILEREGCVLKPYLDSVGVWTDGCGNTHGVIPNGPPITMEKAMEDLKSNLAWVEAAINNNVRVPLEQHQYDALASWIFNIGAGQFLSSTLLRKINAGDPEGAAAEFDRWHIPPEITSRRNGEREQFRGTRLQARIA